MPDQPAGLTPAGCPYRFCPFPTKSPPSGFNQFLTLGGGTNLFGCIDEFCYFVVAQWIGATATRVEWIINFRFESALDRTN